jgi:hypothetical protein
MSISRHLPTRRVSVHAPSEPQRRHGCPTLAVAAHQRGQPAFRIILLWGQWDLTAKAYASRRQQQQCIRKTASKFLHGRSSWRTGRPAGAIQVTRQTAANGYSYRPTQGPGHWQPPPDSADDVQDCEPEPRPRPGGPGQAWLRTAILLQHTCNDRAIIRGMTGPAGYTQSNNSSVRQHAFARQKLFVKTTGSGGVAQPGWKMNCSHAFIIFAVSLGILS